MRDSILIDTSLQKALDGKLTLCDLEAVRLLLSGDSVVDWNRANFYNLNEVDDFLRLHHLDISVLEDKRRIKSVFISSVTYLEEHLGLRFPKELTEKEDIREIFVLASTKRSFSRYQILACAILKLMHVIYHLEVAELRFQVALSEAVLLDEASKQINLLSQKMLKSGLPIVSFYGNRKARNSVITKLLAKRENIAATVFDKLRYRIIMEEPEDLLLALVWLCRHAFPFNYVIPSQSKNTILQFNDMLKNDDTSEIRDILTSNGISDPIYREEKPVDTNIENANSFSGTSYRVINFIVDYPIRIDHLVDLPQRNHLGKVVFVMVEFQVVDRRTARNNEQGENAHLHYKNRQFEEVKSRLRMGRNRKLSALEKEEKDN
jgi:uncharacterized protein (TIGR04552 family)